MNDDNSRGGRSANTVPSSDGISMLKKVVLLVDVNAHRRESRAKIMRSMGVTVHCASSVRGAWSKMDSGAYNLILVDLGADSERAELLVQEIRLKDPRQLVAFLVGSPLFVAKSLRPKGASPLRVSQSIAPSAVLKAKANEKPFDFGQKIKDAEAQEEVA